MSSNTSRFVTQNSTMVREGLMEAILKRIVVKLMHESGLLVSEAAEAVGIDALTIHLWCLQDEAFGQAVNAVQIAKIIRFLIGADELLQSRSWRKLTDDEQFVVKTARELYDILPETYANGFGFLRD